MIKPRENARDKFPAGVRVAESLASAILGLPNSEPLRLMLKTTVISEPGAPAGAFTHWPSAAYSSRSEFAGAHLAEEEIASSRAASREQYRLRH